MELYIWNYIYIYFLEVYIHIRICICICMYVNTYSWLMSSTEWQWFWHQNEVESVHSFFHSSINLSWFFYLIISFKALKSTWLCILSYCIFFPIWAFKKYPIMAGELCRCVDQEKQQKLWNKSETHFSF